MTTLTRRERIFYAAGDTGFNLAWATIELYLLFYYISVLDVPPYLAGLIFLVGSIVDLFADPWLGTWIDSREERISLRRWVVLAAPLMGLALAATFVGPAMGFDGLGWLAASHVALRLSYSLGNIPYAALTVRMSSDAEERIRITATRMQGAAIGGLIASSVYLVLPFADTMRAIPAGAVILAVASPPLLLASMAGVHERRLPQRRDRYAAAPVLLTLFQSSLRLSLLMGIIFFAGLAVSIVHSSLLFVFAELGAKEAGYAIAILPALALLTTAPLFGQLAICIGEAPALLLTTLFFIIALALAAITPPGAWLIAAMALAILGGVGISTLFWILVPQVAEEIEQRTGGFAASKVIGLANLSRKTAQALTPMFVAVGLSVGARSLPLISLLPAAIALATIWIFAQNRTRSPTPEG